VQDQREDEVHERAREENQGPLPALADRRCLGRGAFREGGFVGPQPDDLDVAAEGDRGDPVIRPLPFLPRAEPDREDFDREPEGLATAWRPNS
jgi:hypothetical protein